MNVLLINPSYPQTFWSFDNVLKMLGKKVLLPPLGLLTVAALLPEDWHLKLLDLTFQQISEEDWDECDLVLVSGMVVQSVGILDTIREAKRRGKKVGVGGPWVFHFIDEALQAGADFVARGDGELTVPLMLEALENGESGIVIEAPAWADMTNSPAPRYDLLDINVYVDISIQFSRGCPFQCEFCDITLMFGRQVRTKTPQQILTELKVLYDLGWRRAVFFIDDNFIGNPSKTKELLRELIPWMKERKYFVDFYTQTSVNLAADPELLELMVHAGFFSVFLGIETTDRESLRLTKKFQNAGVDLDEVCRTINTAGLQIIAGCILGFDGEQPGADQRLIDFGMRNGIPEMFVTLLQVVPGTELYSRLQREGRLYTSCYGDNVGSQSGIINFVPTRSVEEIVKEFIGLYNVLYSPEFYLRRVYEHLSRMRPVQIKKGFFMPHASEIRAVLIAIYKHGIVYPFRLKFWKYLLKLAVHSPQRLRSFLIFLVKGEHYFQYRDTISDLLTKQLKDAVVGINSRSLCETETVDR